MVHSDKGRTGFDVWDCYTANWSEDEICEEFGKTASEVYQEMADKKNMDVEDFDRYDLQKYIEESDSYYDKIIAGYKDSLKEYYSEYNGRVQNW